MTEAFLTGFFLGISLIVAIGAQNAYVLRQGILRQYIFYITFFCAIADSLLIAIGVLGISFFLNGFIVEHSKIIFGLSSLWLFTYGVSRILSSLKSNKIILANNGEAHSLLSAISITAIFTFANPHVYLDTIFLIGSVSQQFEEINRIYFTVGACFSSFIWFFGIGYGAKLLTPIMQKPLHWRILDLLIGIIMITLSLNLAFKGGWFG
jgi:L-lysine exporter family protein LysE/ArgO